MDRKNNRERTYITDSLEREEGYLNFEELDGYKSDEQVLDEAGIQVNLDESYDMSTREGREKLAKDIHHELEDVFYTIAEGSQISRTVTQTPVPGELRYQVSEDPLVNNIESDVFNRLAIDGAKKRMLLRKILVGLLRE